MRAASSSVAAPALGHDDEPGAGAPQALGRRHQVPGVVLEPEGARIEGDGPVVQAVGPGPRVVLGLEGDLVERGPVLDHRRGHGDRAAGQLGDEVVGDDDGVVRPAQERRLQPLETGPQGVAQQTGPSGQDPPRAPAEEVLDPEDSGGADRRRRRPRRGLGQQRGVARQDDVGPGAADVAGQPDAVAGLAGEALQGRVALEGGGRDVGEGEGGGVVGAPGQVAAAGGDAGARGVVDLDAPAGQRPGQRAGTGGRRSRRAAASRARVSGGSGGRAQWAPRRRSTTRTVRATIARSVRSRGRSR